MATKKKRRGPKPSPPPLAPREPAEQALIDAIAADPEDDDATRLVYADYLLDRGESLGEYIQLECQLARMEEDDARRPALATRAIELNKAHAKRWLVDVWSLELPKTKFGFRRGLIESIATPFQLITSRAEDIVARAPLLSSLDLSVDGQADRVELERPRNTAALVLARDLAVKGRHAGRTRDRQGPIGDLYGLAGVAFRRLRSLHLSDLRTNPHGLGALLSSPHVATLNDLGLGLGLDGADVAIALEPRWSCELERLDLSGDPIGDDGIAMLASSGRLAKVRDLRLTSTTMTVRGLAELLDGDRLRSIERLWIGWNALGNEGARRLATWRGGANLVEIFIRGAEVTEDALESIRISPNRRALRSLID